MKRGRLICSLFFLLSCQTTLKKETPINKKANYQIQIARGHLINCMYPQALAEMKKALSLQPDHYIINDKIGMVYFFMKQYDLAEQHFLKTLRLRENYTEARVNLAHTLIKKKKWKPALKELKKAEEDLTYHNPAEVYFALGEIYFSQKKYSQAQKYLNSSLNINPQSCDIPFYLGRIAFNQKNHKKAVQMFEKTTVCRKKIKINKKCGPSLLDDLYYFQGISEMKIKQTEKGIQHLQKFINKAQRNNVFLKSAKKWLRRSQAQ